MSPITTHILDIAVGKPAAGIPVVLDFKTHAAGWQTVGEGTTDDDGRISDLLTRTEDFKVGHYRLSFDTSTYFLLLGVDCFFPLVTVSFVIKNVKEHYHVPLLLSRFGYTTYRGS